MLRTFRAFSSLVFSLLADPYLIPAVLGGAEWSEAGLTYRDLSLLYRAGLKESFKAGIIKGGRYKQALLNKPLKSP